LNCFASIILTREFDGKIAADVIDGASARERTRSCASIVAESPILNVVQGIEQRDGERKREKESWQNAPFDRSEVMHSHK
jgi:hypothetical protein